MNSLTWVLFLAYIIVFIIIGASSYRVFDTCVSEDEEEMDNKKGLSAASISLTAVFFVASVACLIFMGGSFSSSICRAITYNKKSSLNYAFGLLAIISGLGSLITSLVSYFMGLETVSNCENINVKDGEEFEKFTSAVTDLNRLYAFVLMSVIIIVGMFIMVSLEKVGSVTDGVSKTVTWFNQKTQFGRSAKCSKGSGRKRASI